MLPDPLTNFEIQRYKNGMKLKFNGVYSRNHLPEIKKAYM